MQHGMLQCSNGIKWSFQLTSDDEQAIRRTGKYLGKKGLDDLVEAIRDNFKLPCPEGSPPETFRERFEQAFVSIGGFTSVCDVAALEKGGRCTVVDFGGPVIQAYMECGKLYVDVSLFNGVDKSPVKITGRDFKNNLPPNWDRNFNANALEVVNEKGLPVFQLINRTPNHIHLNGLFVAPAGMIFGNGDVMVHNPKLPVTVSYKRVFRYPSRQYQGELEKEEAGGKSKQTMINSPGSAQVIGDNNTVNLGTQPRRITVAEAEKILPVLRAHPPQTITVYRISSDTDSDFYGRQIAALLREGGWEVELNGFQILSPMIYGVECRIKDPVKAAIICPLLQEAFGAAGIKITLEGPIDIDPTILVVGKKP